MLGQAVQDLDPIRGPLTAKACLETFLPSPFAITTTRYTLNSSSGQLESRMVFLGADVLLRYV